MILTVSLPPPDIPCVEVWRCGGVEVGSTTDRSVSLLVVYYRLTPVLVWCSTARQVAGHQVTVSGQSACSQDVVLRVSLAE